MPIQISGWDVSRFSFLKAAYVWPLKCMGISMAFNAQERVVIEHQLICFHPDPHTDDTGVPLPLLQRQHGNPTDTPCEAIYRSAPGVARRDCEAAWFPVGCCFFCCCERIPVAMYTITISLSMSMSVCLSICLSVCPSVSLSPSRTHTHTHTHTLSLSLLRSLSFSRS